VSETATAYPLSWPDGRALPGATSVNDWRKALGNPTNLMQAEAVYRDLAMKHHPDRGGSEARMAELNAAIELARQATDGNSAAVSAANLVLRDPLTRGLGVFGAVGTGKSHLAGAIVNACLAANVPAVFMNVVDLLARFRETYGAKATKSEESLVRLYATVDVLVLDDVGKESLGDWTVRTLYALVNRRYEAEKPLIVTSNSSLIELSGRPVARDAEQNTYVATIDRIAEMTGRPWIEITGDSRR
jgi:DNA replication protein DnaC